MIERYYCDDKCNPKVIMSQNTAKEVRTAIKAFLTACSVMTPYSADSVIIRYRVGEYVANNFLADAVIKDWLKASHDVIFAYTMFLEAVEKRIEELLG